MEVITPPCQVDSSKKLVFPYKIERLILRREYVKLLLRSLSIISELDIRDKGGTIIEHGYSIIESVLSLERQRKNIKEQIHIIGKSKWLKLKKIWLQMRQIETEDKDLISTKE